MQETEEKFALFPAIYFCSEYLHNERQLRAYACVHRLTVYACDCSGVHVCMHAHDFLA
jgi:hypothetical protein